MSCHPNSKLELVDSWFRAYDAAGKDRGPVKLNRETKRRYEEKGFTFTRIKRRTAIDESGWG